MYFDDFNILHLSDLHIDNTGATDKTTGKATGKATGKYSNSLKDLITDITQEIKNARIDNIIIIISGDIIHKARYDRIEKVVTNFFEKLHEKITGIVVKKIGDEVKTVEVNAVIIVPGNHDKDIDNDINSIV